jgi:trypsin
MKLSIAATIILLTASYDKTMAMTNATRNMQQNIVGGTPSATGAFPYFTLLGDPFSCGGSLIYEDIVLTAAHCKRWIGGYEVFIGIEDLKDNSNEGVVRVVTKQIQHAKYWGLILGLIFGATNDIMLLKLDGPVIITTPVVWERSITAPSSGETLTVMGFGATSEGGYLSSTLRQVDVLAIDAGPTCDGDRELDFCAGIPEGGKDSCQGDSGECCI